MNLSLSPEILKVIEEHVRSGKYQSAEEVIGAAVANLDQQERIGQLTGSELEAIYPDIKSKLAEGLAAARAGEFINGEEFFDQLERDEQNLPQGRKTA